MLPPHPGAPPGRPGSRSPDRRAPRALLAVVLLALAAGALAVSAILRDRPVEQLAVGLAVAISPLAANLSAGTIKLNQRLRRHLG
jgi:hypothetical protein